MRKNDTLFTNEAPIEQALLIGVDTGHADFDYSMIELENLAVACNITPLKIVTQKLASTNSKFYVGPGKIAEISELLENEEANVVIFNTELSPSQIRNIERELACKVIDRTMLILQIFEQRAQTKEAKLQVEIARLQYFLPRLVGLRASLDRQGGGGASGTFNRGSGEKQIDLDRRQIENQITFLKKELQTVVEQRQTQRRWRKRQDVKTVALVGYTNAGKSTLLNAITAYFADEDAASDKSVFVKDMLFATLQTASRRIDMPNKKAFILTDTVGFVSNLPHHLVEAFKSTLEEIHEADLLLHVIDYSDENAETLEKLTLQVIGELGAKDIPTLRVFNKIDKLANFATDNTTTDFYISAKSGLGLPSLITGIENHIFEDYHLYEIKIPYTRGDITAFYHQNVEVLNEDFTDDGTVLKINATERMANKFHKEILSVEQL